MAASFPQEVGGFDAKGDGQCLKRAQRDVPLAALDGSYIGSVQVAPLGESLLGQMLRLAGGAQILRQSVKKFLAWLA
jgi:hypothetical protein